MAKSESPLFDGQDTWFTGNVVQKNDRVIIKIYESPLVLKESIVIPTVRFPLSGPYEVFDYTNTNEIGTGDNEEEIIKIFNSIKYKIGFCYYNADALTFALCKAGYDAETYVGWLLAPQPTHHAWTVLRKDGQISVLDLSENVCAFVERGLFKPNLTLQQRRELVAKSMKELLKQPNYERCFPVGIPAPLYLYVGSKSNGNDGAKLYMDLINQYPDHPAASLSDSLGLTKTQKMILEDSK